LRRELGPGPLLVVPGIRPAGAATHDQQRTGSPRDAVRAGASLLVIGRPLREAADPAAAADLLAREIEGSST
jgi:orotidine-5'-phosphate decarboxylase